MTLCHSYIDSNPFDQLILNPLTCFRDTIADWFGCFQLFSPLTIDFLDGVFIEPALVVWVIHWFIDSWSIDPSLTRCFCIIDALSLAHWLIDSGYFASLHWIIVVVSLSHWWVVSLVHWNRSRGHLCVREVVFYSSFIGRIGSCSTRVEV